MKRGTEAGSCHEKCSWDSWEAPQRWQLPLWKRSWSCLPHCYDWFIHHLFSCEWCFSASVFFWPSFSTVWYFLASKHVVSDFRLHFLGAREMWRIVKCLANLFIFRPNFFTVYIELSSWIEGWLEVQRPHSGKTVSVGRRQLCLL